MRPVLVLTALSLAGCASGPATTAGEGNAPGTSPGITAGTSPVVVAPAESSASQSPVSTEGTSTQQAPASESASSSSSESLRAMELAVWNDPAFRRQFAESYMAETEIEPKVTIPEREQMQKVLDLISTEKQDQAVALLEKGRGPAASAVFDFTLGNLHFQREQFDQAVAAYSAAVAKFPKFRRAWRNLALIHVRQQDFAKALPALTRVIELGGGDGITYGLLGFALSSADNHIAAESAYRMAIMLDPGTLDWKMGMARTFFKQTRYADAVSLCGQLLALHPDRADLWLLQANAYIGLNQPLRASENYELVERLGKSTVDSLNMLADIYINEGLFDLAVNAYTRALEKDSKARPDRALRAAKVLTSRGALKETRRLVETIQQMRGEQLATEERKDLLKLRARVAVAEGAGEEEARVLEEIVALDPLDGEALILLGQHRVKAGDTEKAVFFFERASKLEKFEADAKVRHAQLLVSKGRYMEALPLLRSAQQLKPRENIQSYLEQVERIAKSR